MTVKYIKHGDQFCYLIKSFSDSIRTPIRNLIIADKIISIYQTAFDHIANEKMHYTNIYYYY